MIGQKPNSWKNFSILGGKVLDVGGVKWEFDESGSENAIHKNNETG